MSELFKKWDIIQCINTDNKHNQPDPLPLTAGKTYEVQRDMVDDENKMVFIHNDEEVGAYFMASRFKYITSHEIAVGLRAIFERQRQEVESYFMKCLNELPKIGKQSE